MPLSFDAVIFDFDGLILDTETPEVEAWETEFRRHGLELERSWWRDYTGRGPESIGMRTEDLLAARVGGGVDGHTFVDRAIADKLGRIHLEPIREGIVELLASLQQFGRVSAVASSSNRAWVDGHLERLGLIDHFPIRCCIDDVSVGKPAPDLYLLACSRLGLEPSKCIALEDSTHGLAAAKAAGLFAVAVPNPITVDFDLSAADVLVPTLKGVDAGWLEAVFTDRP